MKIKIKSGILMLQIITAIILFSCEKEKDNKPVAMFIASDTAINIGQSVQFTDQSTNDPTVFIWLFGDGVTSFVQNPSHNYTRIGSFTVTLTIENSFGSDSLKKINYINVNCSSNENGTITDYRDGQTYSTIKIGGQWWMAENLNYNTENIVNDISSENGFDKIYGHLYDWETACDICPSGWHLPTLEEWITLTNYLGGSNMAGGKLKEASAIFWDSPNTGATNSTCFSALPGGYCVTNNAGFPKFNFMGEYAYFWTSSDDDLWTNNAWYRRLSSQDEKLISSDTWKTNSLSVRCVMD